MQTDGLPVVRAPHSSLLGECFESPGSLSKKRGEAAIPFTPVGTREGFSENNAGLENELRMASAFSAAV